MAVKSNQNVVLMDASGRSVEYARLQMRRGLESQFDASKMLPAEFAVTTDTKKAYLAFAAGDVKRLSTYEDMTQDLADALAEIEQEYLGQISTATAQAQSATSAANTATQSANTATANANAAADEARQAVWNNKNLTNSTSASESQVETAAGAAVLTRVDGKTLQGGAPTPDVPIPVQGVGGKTGDESFGFNSLISSEDFNSKLPITLTEPLFDGDKIMQVKAGQTYVDADGTAQTADRDLWGILHSMIVKKFDGSETWYAPAVSGDKKRLQTFTTDKIKTVPVSQKTGKLKCNMYEEKTANETYSRKTGIATQDSTGGNIMILVFDENYQTANAFKAKLSGTPMFAVFELSTPYFEPFTDQTPFFGWTTPTGGCTITTDDPMEPIISADTAQTPEGSYLLTGYIDGLRARNNETVIAALSDQVVALTQKSMEG